jgi:hypothetical protein
MEEGQELLRRHWWVVRTIFATDTYLDGGPGFFESDLVAINFNTLFDLRILPADPRDIRAELLERMPEWRPGTATRLRVSFTSSPTRWTSGTPWSPPPRTAGVQASGSSWASTNTWTRDPASATYERCAG